MGSTTYVPKKNIFRPVYFKILQNVARGTYTREHTSYIKKWSKIENFSGDFLNKIGIVR